MALTEPLPIKVRETGTILFIVAVAIGASFCGVGGGGSSNGLNGESVFNVNVIVVVEQCGEGLEKQFGVVAVSIAAVAVISSRGGSNKRGGAPPAFEGSTTTSSAHGSLLSSGGRGSAAADNSCEARRLQQFRHCQKAQPLEPFALRLLHKRGGWQWWGRRRRKKAIDVGCRGWPPVAAVGE